MDTIQIIIPTYNAREGIIKTISQIKFEMPKSLITIVDDNSPDKTAELINSTFNNDKNVKTLVRKNKNGRGSAVIDGLRDALKNKKTNYFIEMDGDFCHNPVYIPRMVAACKNADVVIASKYLSGSYVSGLSIKRKLLSKLLNLGAKIILQVPITDYSNGYRCYTRPVVEYIVKQKMKSKGFIMLSEVIYLIYKKNFKITEIPFNFKQKNVTKSNLTPFEVWEAIWTLLRIKFF